ncbi:MAG TPA: tetraacyldisaccharide 4'-kinase, partial [Rhizomicrobium sp.]
IVCVGNLTVGGSGKTPIAMALAQLLQAKGVPVALLSRGYRGKFSGAVCVDPKLHDSHFVGDEALLLARVAPTIVASDREAGARFAENQGARIIVMDDGHQNFALAKDLSIVVVEGERAFGNGKILPAGPLREPVRQGLARADVVMLTGFGSPALPGFTGVVCRANLIPDRRLDGTRVVAFTGIARPMKFFETLAGAGADVIERHDFGDHHAFTRNEIAMVKEAARRANATLITTDKDLVRLSDEDREGIDVLRVQAHLFDMPVIERLMDPLLRKVRGEK